jgi:hypothetical protein
MSLKIIGNITHFIPYKHIFPQKKLQKSNYQHTAKAAHPKTDGQKSVG